MHKKDLVLNDQQGLICRKTKLNQTKRFHLIHSIKKMEKKTRIYSLVHVFITVLIIQSDHLNRFLYGPIKKQGKESLCIS